MKDKNIDIILIPNDESKFLEDLTKFKKASRVYVFNNGKTYKDIWSANKITSSSNLLSNIKTNNFYRKNKTKLRVVYISIIYPDKKYNTIINNIIDLLINFKEIQSSKNDVNLSTISQNSLIFNTNSSLNNYLSTEQLKNRLNFRSFIDIYNECEKISGLDDLEIRNHGEISPQAHSDIISGRINLSKEKAIQYAFGFQNKEACIKFLNETIGGLGNSKRDSIIKIFIEEEEFDIEELNDSLDQFGCEKIFKRRGKDF